MTDSELKFSMATALLRIKVVTGWIMPSGEYQTILEDELFKKLREDYQDLNFEEIQYAFRKYGTALEDWGKDFNLNMFDKILQDFIDRRSFISETERKIKEVPPVQKIYTDEEIENQRRGEFERAYQAMRKGSHPHIYEYYGELLTKDGIIAAPEALTDFIVESLNTGREAIYKKS